VQCLSKRESVERKTHSPIKGLVRACNIFDVSFEDFDCQCFLSVFGQFKKTVKVRKHCYLVFGRKSFLLIFDEGGSPK
jgi:hypothetical protein